MTNTTTTTTLKVINDMQLSKISGGQEYISDENTLSNVINYYIDLLPFTSRSHVKIKYNADNFTCDPNNKNLFTRNISQTVELSDMKWKNLSNAERFGVLLPVIGAGFITGCTGITTLIRYLSRRSSN